MARVNQAASAVQQLRQQIIEGVPRGGNLGSHYRDVQALKPEIASVDVLTFRAEITVGGVITQPDPLSIPSGMLGELVAIKGFVQKPATEPTLMPLVRFNLRDMARSDNILTSPIEMAYLVNSTGSGEGICWERGLYVFDPGSRVKATFEVEGDSSLGYANLASDATKYWGIALVMNLYAV